MLMIVAVVLIVCWLLGLFVFKITKTAIHLVLLIAIVALAVYFIGGVR